MSEEILINITPPETRVAVIENGVVQEIIIERTARRGLVGNIYKGKVCRVLPGMQAAFVDIGLERAAFLHASDIFTGDRQDSQQITELVREGGEIVVQVVKDPLGSKGARLTTNISIPSRYMVLVPQMQNIGVSQKIEDDTERARLRQILSAFAEESDIPGGFIARTAAEGAGEEALRYDMQYLQRLWRSIQERAAEARAVTVLHEDLPLGLRALRDLVGPEVERVRIDSRSTWEKARLFAHKFLPDSDAQIEYYPGERPIFDLYGVEDEIQKALRRTVELKSGGHLVIDQTEAMTTIDV
ncbi:MAG: S1 RNA-binding domain-containing protein, partial [Gammaproteobacteria bacterium]